MKYEEDINGNFVYDIEKHERKEIRIPNNLQFLDDIGFFTKPLSLEQIEKASKTELRNELLKIRAREKKLDFREKENQKKLQKIIGTVLVPYLVPTLFSNINPCGEMKIDVSAPSWWGSERKSPAIHIKKVCPSCKGTKKILLLNFYVDCLDCV